MKRIVLTSVLVILTQFAGANVLLNHLNKLYEKDQSKCFERSKWFMKHWEERAEPYLFAFKVQSSRVDKANSTVSAFYRTRTALKYAMGFKELADEDLKSELNWLEMEESFTKEVKELIILLEGENEQQYADLLSDKFDKFSNIEDSDNEILEIVVAREENVKNTVFEASTSGLMFNMPTGKEIIPSSSISSEVELLRLINQEREKQGLEELVWNEDLANAARYHAFDLGSQDYFKHETYDRIDGNLVRIGDSFERIRKFYSDSHVNSENIAAGDARANGTYKQWYNSKGHFENMFNPNSKKVGIGYVNVPGSTYGHYWVFCTAE